MGRLQRHHLDRPWGRLRYWRAGRGPVLIAVHGLGGSGRYWSGLAGAVGDRWTVIAPDLGGFGHSDMPAVDYDRRFHLDNFDALVGATAGESSVTVVGHSLGGALAGLWMARHPQSVTAAALVAAPYPGGMSMPPGRRGVYEKDQRASWQRVYRTVQTVWPVITFPVRSRIFPHPVIADFMRHTLASYWGTAQAVLWDPSAQEEVAPLARLTAPLLLLTSTEDRSVPPEAADRWAALAPQAERLVVAGGHQLLYRGGLEPLVRWLGSHGG